MKFEYNLPVSDKIELLKHTRGKPQIKLTSEKSWILRNIFAMGKAPTKMPPPKAFAQSTIEKRAPKPECAFKQIFQKEFHREIKSTSKPKIAVSLKVTGSDL